MEDIFAKRQYSFDELRMLYESTVHVTEWRNTTNRFYYSVTVAIFAAIGVVFFFGYDQSANAGTRNLARIGIFILSMTGIFVSIT
ncbi:MAG: hypothetical protein WBP94_00730, partial [Rhodomicrobiaceae bacterium]